MANSMRFVILGDDRASAAFDKFTRSVEKSSTAVDRNTGTLTRNQKSTVGLGRATADLTGHVTGAGDAMTVMNKKSNIMLRGLAGLSLGTGLLESSVSALVGTTLALSAGLVAAGIGLGAYGAALQPIMGRVSELTAIQFAAADGAKLTNAQLTKLAQLMKTTPRPIVDFANALTGARTAYHNWAFSLAQPVLAPLTRGLGMVNPLLRLLTPYVRAAASALDVLIGKLGRGIRSTGFQQWLQYMLPLVKPVITGLGTAIGNLVVGFGNILSAFSPFATGVVKGIDTITRRFRDWTAGLTSNTGFGALVKQWKQNWPLVQQGLGELWQLLKNVASAMADMTTPSNSAALWQVANPLLALAVSLSAHPVVVQVLLYFLAVAKAGSQIKGVFGALKDGWGGVTKFLALVTGGKVQLGMQSAGDTMLVASRNMQAAADTMVGAGGKAEAAGAAGTAGSAEAGAAGSRVGAAGGLSGLLAAAAAPLGIALAAGVAGYFVKNFGDQLAQQGGQKKIEDAVNTQFSGIPGYNIFAGYFARSMPALGNFLTRTQHSISSAFDTVRHNVSSRWDQMWSDTAGRAERWRKADEALMDNVRHGIASRFDNIRHDVSSRWDQMWSNTVGRARSGINSVLNWLASFRHSTANAYDNIRHDIASAWNRVWANTVAQVRGGISTVLGWFRGLPSRVIGALFGLGHSLAAFARASINEMWTGFKNTWSTVIHWFTGLPHTILHALGIHSPPSWAIDAGKHIMAGLHIGLGHGLGALMNFTTSIGKSVVAGLTSFGGGGSGVQRWAGLVARVLRMEGLPAGLTGNVLRQIASESSGNPMAINLTDSNALRGDPSRGLLQTIGGTFAAYHWPGTSWNIYDPLANIAAAINYARHQYGPTLMSGGMGIGSGHGYAAGGPINEPIAGLGLRTGQRYRFGEAGSEIVSGQVDLKTVASLLATNNMLLRQLLGLAESAPRKTGAAVGGAINGTSRNAALSR